MNLKPGEKLGPYEILSRIGEGGMGEVWKARDARLGRDVALKVSKDEFTARFRQEARTVASLNHPHVCTLFDVGPNYLVMEMIEGVALKGPLSVEKAVEYAGQILDALDAAHRKGITHRDLKPANILITKQGIKLLDFGLAKKALGLAAAMTTRRWARSVLRVRFRGPCNICLRNRCRVEKPMRGAISLRLAASCMKC